MPAAGTKLARSSSLTSTTASSWPSGMRSREATRAEGYGAAGCRRGAGRGGGAAVADWRLSMRLLPREQDRLLLFLAAELARKRRARGLRLNQAEAVALISDEVCEAARDGRSYAEAEAAGYAALGPGDVAEGVPSWSAASRSRRCSPTAAGCSFCTIRSMPASRRHRASPRSSGSPPRSS